MFQKLKCLKKVIILKGESWWVILINCWLNHVEKWKKSHGLYFHICILLFFISWLHTENERRWTASFWQNCWKLNNIKHCWRNCLQQSIKFLCSACLGYCRFTSSAHAGRCSLHKRIQNRNCHIPMKFTGLKEPTRFWKQDLKQTQLWKMFRGVRMLGRGKKKDFII